jgi:hypothetical protein
MTQKNTGPEAFWNEREKRFGGSVVYRTFAKFLGNSNTQLYDLPGLLYHINDQLIFEDFEKENWLSKLVQRDSDYEKTEFHLQLSAIERIQWIARSSAMDIIDGKKDGREEPPVSRIKKFLAGSVTQVLLTSGRSVFFEIVGEKEFAEHFRDKIAS